MKNTLIYFGTATLLLIAFGITAAITQYVAGNIYIAGLVWTMCFIGHLSVKAVDKYGDKNIKARSGSDIDRGLTG